MNVSRRTFLASAALFALVRPNLLLKEELSALVTGSSEYYLNRFVYDLPGGGPLRGQAESGRTAAE